MGNGDISPAAWHWLPGLHRGAGPAFWAARDVRALCSCRFQQHVHPAVQVITVDAERTNLLMFHSDLTAGNMELDKGKPQNCVLLIPRSAPPQERPAMSSRHYPAAEVARSNEGS